MGADFVLALDQGTTSSRAIVFDRDGGTVAVAQQEYPQTYPFPGHVTHDPEDIWSSQLAVARQAIEAVPDGAAGIAAIGITNQRETTVVWDRATGEPVAPAIVWQSRITADRCAALKDAGHEERVRLLTGLPLDAYFSGPKIAHILDETPGLRARAEAGELAVGEIEHVPLDPEEITFHIAEESPLKTDGFTAAACVYQAHVETFDENIAAIKEIKPHTLDPNALIEDLGGIEKSYLDGFGLGRAEVLSMDAGENNQY